MRVWVIDTGSIVEIRRGTPQGKVRRRITGELDYRVNTDSLLYPPEVVVELERVTEAITKQDRPDDPFVWAKRNEARATRHGHLYEGARQVLARVPNLIDAEKVAVSGIDDADPYVVALALALRAEGHEPTIITQDVNTKPNKTALADAAGVFGIPCVRFHTFLVTEGIWDGREED